MYLSPVPLRLSPAAPLPGISGHLCVPSTKPGARMRRASVSTCPRSERYQVTPVPAPGCPACPDWSASPSPPGSAHPCFRSHTPPSAVCVSRLGRRRAGQWEERARQPGLRTSSGSSADPLPVTLPGSARPPRPPLAPPCSPMAREAVPVHRAWLREGSGDRGPNLSVAGSWGSGLGTPSPLCHREASSFAPWR